MGGFPSSDKKNSPIFQTGSDKGSDASCDPTHVFHPSDPSSPTVPHPSLQRRLPVVNFVLGFTDGPRSFLLSGHDPTIGAPGPFLSRSLLYPVFRRSFSSQNFMGRRRCGSTVNIKITRKRRTRLTTTCLDWFQCWLLPRWKWHSRNLRFSPTLQPLTWNVHRKLNQDHNTNTRPTLMILPSPLPCLLKNQVTWLCTSLVPCPQVIIEQLPIMWTHCLSVESHTGTCDSTKLCGPVSGFLLEIDS